VAGNRATRALVGEAPILVDTTQPSADAVDADALLHVRVPWGMVFDPTPGAEYSEPFQVVHSDAFLGGDAEALIPAEAIAAVGEEILFARVFDAQSEGAELGRIQPVVDEDAGGADAGPTDDLLGWAPAGLATRDAPEVWISAVDSAGNESPRVRVNRGLWVGSLGGKQPGVGGDNPHSLFATRAFLSQLFPLGGAESTFPDPVIEAVAPPPDGGVPDDGGDGETGGVGIGVGQGGYEGFVPDSPEQLLRALEGGGWWSPVGPSDVYPSDAEGTSLTWDASRGRTVAFGDQRGVADSDLLFELDEAQWTQRCVQTFDCLSARPTPRLWHAAAYLPRLARTAIIGGCTPSITNDCGSILGQVWTWDGVVYAPIACGDDCAAAAARHRHAVATDPGTAGAFLFGGCLDTGCTELSSELWRFDGDAWVLLHDGTGNDAPAPRYDMALSATADTVLIFGGCGAGAPGSCSDERNDLWAFDLEAGTWAEAPSAGLWPSAAPQARMTLGVTETLSNPDGFHLLVTASETWRLDDSGWQQATLVDPENDGDPTSVSGGFTWDAALERGLLLADGELWVLVERSSNTHSWMRVASSSHTRPTGRAGARVSTDPATGWVVMQGGTALTRDTWVWKGARWEEACPLCTPEGDGASSNMDGAGGDVFLHAQGDTYRLDLEAALPANTWVSVGATGPANLDFPAMAQASVDSTLLFGGKPTVLQPVDDTWVLRADTWRSANPATGPAGRFKHQMTWAPGLGGAVLFGGCGGTQLSICDEFLDDTWVGRVTGDAVEWTELGSGPLGRTRAAFAWDPERAAAVLYGGSVNGLGTAIDDVWELNGDGWRPRWQADPLANGSPGARRRVSFAQDRLGGGLLTFGGDDGRGDTWRWHGGEEQRPAHVLFMDLTSAGNPADTTLEAMTIRWLGGGDAEGGDGGRLYVWESGRWTPIAVDGAAVPESPALIEATLLGGDRLQSVPVDPGVVGFAFAPRANGQDVSRVTSLYADVFVVYRLPPPSNDPGGGAP
jgi:hypothetical protein